MSGGASTATSVSDVAVVLLSGGMDSCVTVAVAAKSHQLALLHLDYGQRTRRRERRAFVEIADHFRVPSDRRLIVEADFLGRIGASALTDASIPVPKSPGSGIPITYVPFRNAHLLSLGVSWAEVLGASAVFLGVVEDDSSGYPDCTRAFCEAFAQAAKLGTRAESSVEIQTPVIHNTKWEIVTLGTELGAPLHLTWSCYADEDAACGRCDSCRLRLDAFSRAGVRDPAPYRVHGT